MNESNASGVLDQAKGKLKQAFGEATNDQTLANEGVADQMKGHVKEAWGNTKDTAADLKHSHEAHTASAETEAHTHNLRDDIAHAAESTKDSINRGLNNLKRNAND